jgi:hypothetical protein
MTRREIWENLKVDFRTVGCFCGRGVLFIVRWVVGISLVGTGIVIGIVIVWMVAMALFGGFFEANKDVLKDTARAQSDIGRALYSVFNDPGRLDVRNDYSVYGSCQQE